MIALKNIYHFTETELEWKQMRWIDDAVQNRRDVALGTDILLPVRTMREVVAKQQEHLAKRQRESKLQCIYNEKTRGSYIETAVSNPKSLKFTTQECQVWKIGEVGNHCFVDFWDS
jgi:hypothetical protein